MGKSRPVFFNTSEIPSHGRLAVGHANHEHHDKGPVLMDYLASSITITITISTIITIIIFAIIIVIIITTTTTIIIIITTMLNDAQNTSFAFRALLLMLVDIWCFLFLRQLSITQLRQETSQTSHHLRCPCQAVAGSES